MQQKDLNIHPRLESKTESELEKVVEVTRPDQPRGRGRGGRGPVLSASKGGLLSPGEAGRQIHVNCRWDGLGPGGSLV